MDEGYLSERWKVDLVRRQSLTSKTLNGSGKTWIPTQMARVSDSSHVDLCGLLTEPMAAEKSSYARVPS